VTSLYPTYTPLIKRQAATLLPLTSPDAGRFSKFFHNQADSIKNYSVVVIKYPTIL